MCGLVVVAALGSSIPMLVIITAIIYTPGSYRIARSLSVNVNAMDFVQVARARGEGIAYIMRDEILPNVSGPILADFGLRFVFVVLLLSSLSFLGLGVQDLRVVARNDKGEETDIVKSVSFSVARGEVVALIGESGSGKTTIALS